jgi:hypothetical protein
MKLPAASTIAELLRSKGLSHARKRRVRTPPYGQPFAAVEQANQTLCADFKGWFLNVVNSRRFSLAPPAAS